MERDAPKGLAVGYAEPGNQMPALAVSGRTKPGARVAKAAVRLSAAIRLAGAVLLLALSADRALAWGDEGHEIVALIAAQNLRPEVLARVNAMLAADTANSLTEHDIASEATWADKFRDSNTGGAKAGTGQWHFVDIEVDAPDELSACFGHPVLAGGQPGYPGLAQDCVVDKIDGFRRELADPATASAEKLLALKFLLHFVGDVHQPRHASDEHDRGGNSKLLEHSVSGSRNLHAFWDTAAVATLGEESETVAADLGGRITPEQKVAWAGGAPLDWAQESFALAKTDAYGQLPAAEPDGKYTLTPAYDKMATADAALQLSKAGVRLAAVLNQALAVQS